MKTSATVFSLFLATSISSAEVRNDKCVMLIDVVDDTRKREMILNWAHSLSSDVDKKVIRASGKFRGMGAFQVPFPDEFSATFLGLPHDSEILVALGESNELQDVIVATAQGVGIYVDPNGDKMSVALYTLEEGRNGQIGVMCLRPDAN